MNALEEIIKHIGEKEVENIHIFYISGIFTDGEKTNEFKGSLDQVSKMLNFDYDDGYGTQELYGVIWYANGTWSERYEYGGSEWWVHMERPDIKTFDRKKAGL